MKFSKSRLDKIITEEVSRVLESAGSFGDDGPGQYQYSYVPGSDADKRSSLPYSKRRDDEGYSKFQSAVNDFLDSAGYEPGVWYFWKDEDTLVALGNPEDASEMAAQLSHAPSGIGGSPYLSPAAVELEDGSWAIKLNAQMTQDR